MPAVNQNVLKYAGGKGQLLPELLRYIPTTFNFYYEPFIGGGALFFELAKQNRANQERIINDKNSKLISMYLELRDNVDEVIRCLSYHVNSEEHFYKTRLDNMMVGSPAKRAADLIYLNRTCFNGIFRENKKGQFNVPYGHNPNACFCDPVGLKQASGLLQRTIITSEDFQESLLTAQPGDLVYLDSPYAPLSATSDFSRYQKEGFSVEDHTRLRDLAKKLISKKVHVILSASSAPLTYELYADMGIIEIEARRSINSKTDKRAPIKEVLVVSPWLKRRRLPQKRYA